MSPDRAGRCAVCWLPSRVSPCSARCRGLRATKQAALADRASLEEAIVAAVRALRPGTTVCPGVLSEGLLRERGFSLDARDALLCLREVLFDLRAARKIRFSQKGVVVPLNQTRLRGPFRVTR